MVGTEICKHANLIRVLESPAINTVVGSVEVPFWEPSNVSVLEAARPDGPEGDVPMQQLRRHL